MKAAIMGYGTIGSGVYEVLDNESSVSFMTFSAYKRNCSPSIVSSTLLLFLEKRDIFNSFSNSLILLVTVDWATNS